MAAGILVLFRLGCDSTGPADTADASPEHRGHGGGAQERLSLADQRVDGPWGDVQRDACRGPLGHGSGPRNALWGR